jgi:hypothetical protein
MFHFAGLSNKEKEREISGIRTHLAKIMALKDRLQSNITKIRAFKPKQAFSKIRNGSRGFLDFIRYFLE